MKTYHNVTLCLTIGKRPIELRQTLDSLLAKIKFEHIIAINDFGDEETNTVFRELCPTGQLISLGYNMGHHKAIDYMYSKVQTPYVFHCEDDWFFDSKPDIEKIIQLLEKDKDITAVLLRKLDDMHFDNENLAKIHYVNTSQNIEIAYVNQVHEQWFGYGFNPHVAPIRTWHTLRPFSDYKKERHISRVFREQGKNMVFLRDGNCYHIGENNSIANPPKKNWILKIKSKIFG